MVSNSRWLLQRQEDRRHISFCSTILSTWLPSCVTHTHTHTGLHTYLALPSGLCPSSPTKGQTWAPEVKVPSPDYWTTREFPSPSMKCYGLKKKKKKLAAGAPAIAFCQEGGRWGKGGRFPAQLAQKITWTFHTTSLFISSTQGEKEDGEHIFF